MMKDITLGQYYPADSVIHKLDPRVKLMGTMVFIISLFAFRSVSCYIFATLALAAVIKASKVPLKFIVKGLKAIFILMMITVAFNLFLTPGTPVFQEADDYHGRNRDGSIYGDPSGLSHYRIFRDDPDNHTE